MSPTVFKESGFRFFFFSREEKRRHVHVSGSDGEAKFWLEPEVSLARNHGFSTLQLAKIRNIVDAHSDELIRAWNQYFSS